jgi:ABC-type phosphate/phosphonate transport system substrate-binding protein
VRGHEYELDEYAGVIITQADNNDINTIYDLQNKVIAAGGISILAAGQSQMYEMERAGLSHLTSPKQMIFTSNQDLVVKGIMNREFQVGFVRTDQIERTMLDNGQLVDPNIFKVRTKVKIEARNSHVVTCAQLVA